MSLFCSSPHPHLIQIGSASLRTLPPTVRIPAILAAVLFLSSALLSRSQEADDPASELASFEIADGFEVNLFASEADGVIKPIQIRFDATGRIWVIGSTVYPQIQPGQIPNDKVLILEDVNGDGRSDKTTVFADGLMIPTGLEVGHGGAYVGQGTELLFLKDTDGDGKADERRVVLRGFGTGDNHQNINSFLWGPGGELWMSQGLHIHSNVETPWGIVRLNQAGIWRLWPRRLKLEGFYGSQYEPQNPWGFVFTDSREPIVLAGNNSSAIYPVPGLVPNRRDIPPHLIWKNGNGRKVSGGDIVGTSHFPESWQGALILGGYINNAVWALKIIEDGSGFGLEDLPPMIRSTDRRFRPVDSKFGPDGALYICDWYNPIIGHYQASFRHPDRDKTHGRIWRITAKGRPLTPKPLLADAPFTNLIENITSSDRWTRRFTKRVLADRPASTVIGALGTWLSQTNVSEQTLADVVGVYQSHDVVVPELAARLCTATDAAVRAYGASVVGAWADRLPDPLALLRPLISDADARVRLQAVVACAYVRKSEAMETLARAFEHPTDRFIDYALKQAVFSLKPYWLPVFKAGKLDLENNPLRLEWLVRVDGTADVLEAVRELTRSAELSQEARDTFFRILAETGDSRDIAAILSSEDESMQSRLLPQIIEAARSRSIEQTEELVLALRRFVENKPNPLRAEALVLAGIWDLQAFRPAATAIAIGDTFDVASRRAAIESLLLLGGDSSQTVITGLASSEIEAVSSAAIVAACRMNPLAAAPLAAEGLSRFTEEDSIVEIFTAFLERQGGSAALTTALATKRPPKAIAEIGLRIMNAGGRESSALNVLLVENAGMKREEGPMKPKEVQEFLNEVIEHGNAERGKAVFQRPELGCIACHTVNGQGGVIGPDLSALGTAQPVEFILGAILDPQKEIKEGYTSIAVETKDGSEYQGNPVRETPEQLVLRDALRNRDIRVRKDTIVERRQIGSVMPTGLVDTINRFEFRDLVRYLSELGKPK